ncbi:MAG TPA: DNA-binding domain-containing protein [Pirellulales bacterium]
MTEREPFEDDRRQAPNDNPPSLSIVQRWLQAVLMHPDGVESGMASDEARRQMAIDPDDCELVIARSRNLTSVERLSIYQNAYFARLLECMRSVYPLVARTIGDEAYDALVMGYLQTCPSQSYTLDALGDRFASFLDETRPDRDEEGRPTEEWPDFLIDLARLEWTISQVFDGPGNEGRPTLSAEQLLAIQPDEWPGLRLLPAPCLRLLEFHFPVNEYFTRLRELPPDAEPPDIPSSEASWLALSRKDFVVRRHALSRPQYVLLAALADGQTIGAAIAYFAATAEADFETLALQLNEWFRTWAAAGFFIGHEPHA